MRISAKQKIENLSKNNNWLFQHMITAFWHGFGISNGLTITKDDLTEVTYKKGSPRKVLVVKPEFMRAKLDKYIEWLEGYSKSWNGEGFEDIKPEDFYDQHHEGRNAITKMIELLQI